MSRQSVTVRAARLVQRIPLHWAQPVEAPLVRSRAAGRPNLVFLLALPRSGSTLTYQALIHSIQPLYLSNLWNLLYGLPWFGGQFTRHYCFHHRSDFRSSHGFVEGMCGPAEGLRFWSFWTGCGLDETAAKPVSEKRLTKRIDYFRDVVRSLATPDKPMVAGYLGHALVTEQLRVWFPEAVFLRLHRDPLSNAASILRSRKAGSKAWFSVLPSECVEVKGQGPHAEVAAQVYWLNRRLEWLEGDEKTFHLSYEHLCRDPEGELRRVIDKANDHGMAWKVREALPSSFEYRVVSPGDNIDTGHLWNELKRLETKHGKLRTSP